jgi:hypothetical protein
MVHRLGRRAFLLAVAGIGCAGLGATPVGAQTPPIIIIDTFPQPSLGIAADEVDETFTGHVTGRADVDLDVDSYHEEGQTTAR